MEHYHEIIENVLQNCRVSVEEGKLLYEKAPLPVLMAAAGIVRKRMVPGNEVGWQIDRNVNITNICFSQCRFCNFCRKPNDTDTYITSIDEYRQKIDELYAKGGNQLLLQGGMHPRLGIEYYEELFSVLKSYYPDLKLHALGPPEVVHLSKMAGLSSREVLERLVASGLDSLPGAGAEILSDRVRKIVSPAKATTNEWLDVMREAHRLNLPTSATMMYGHVETIEERIEHLARLREVQDECPEGNYGFISFIPWPFQDSGTVLNTSDGIRAERSMTAYLRIVAISRLMLDNIINIQASILTTGRDTAMMALYGGANDLGSIMIEENVVSAAGSNGMMNASQLKEVISSAGFTPRLRNQKYETLREPEGL